MRARVAAAKSTTRKAAEPRRKRAPTDSMGPIDDEVARWLAAAAHDPALLRADARWAPEAEPVYVTKPFLPPFSEFEPMLREIWRTRILTNGGPFHQELERRLAAYLGVPYIALFNNATTALVIALRALGLSGDVITTPYSFVATSHALMWGDLAPVFADVDPATLNLDPAAAQAAITPRTSALLPVHCYGHPCDVDGLAAVARRHGLKILYDAAHAFGVEDHGGSILRHGDLSVLSFHATKVFNTFEGGAIVCADAKRKDQIEKLKNFGHDGETSVVEVGLNGKMSEFNAALGLLQLRHIETAMAQRRAIDTTYRAALSSVPGITCLGDAGEVRANYAYFPILIGPDHPRSRDEVWERLKREGIHTRRYFHPLISDHPMYRSMPSADRRHLPVAARAADTVLCLPIYPDLDRAIIARIVACIAAP